MNSAQPIIGLLDLQGDVIEHERAIQKCGAQTLRVKTSEDLAKVDGLIMPGGESTTIGKLMNWYGLHEVIRDRAHSGMPIYGTCAGAILLAKNLSGHQTAQTLNLMNITIERNAYGRQLDSFETTLECQLESSIQMVEAVFIRAPKILSVESNVQTLAHHNDEIVLAQEGNLLASTFHPELTNDLTIHQYFLKMVSSFLESKS